MLLTKGQSSRTLSTAVNFRVKINLYIRIYYETIV
jgi:hypothetical protein